MKQDNWFGIEPMIEYVYAWFENHPNPEEIDCHSFSLFGDHKVEVYFADQVFDCWAVKITCKTARRAVYLSQLFYKTTCQMDIDQILIGNKLFFLKDQRF